MALSRLARALAVVGVAAALGLAGCSDDGEPTDDASPTTTAQSGPGNDAGETSGGDAPDGGGNLVAEGVVIEVTGIVDQTFRGGACTVSEGMLQIVAGYATGVGPNRPQDSPYGNGTAFIIGPAEHGEHDTGYMLNVVRESDGAFILAETPRVTIEPGFLSGSFESEQVSGSWSCPAVLTAEQLNDLVADYSDE